MPLSDRRRDEDARPSRDSVRRDRYPESGFDDDFALFLHRCAIVGRWACIVCCWAAFGIPSLWFLRDEIALWREFFTWAAVWYAFRVHPWPAFGLSLSYGVTLATLVWQSRNILFGLSARELAQQHQRAAALRSRGNRSTLWLWFISRSG